MYRGTSLFLLAVIVLLVVALVAIAVWLGVLILVLIVVLHERISFRSYRIRNR